MTITPKNIIDEQERMDTEFRDCEKLKELAIQLTYPGREPAMDWYNTFDDKKRTKKSRVIYDPTAIAAREVWGNGILGNYMPKSTNWWVQQMSDMKLMESKRVRQWLQDTDEHLRAVLTQSGPDEANYYNQKLVSINDAGVIGDSFMYIEHDEESGKQMFMCPHPREFRIRRDFWGRVVAIHHRFNKTIGQIKDEFGEGSLSESQKLALENSPNQKCEIIHAIHKNKDYEPGKAGVVNMKWQHKYLNVEFKKIIKDDGSETLNPIPWSLNRPSTESYGRGIVSQMFVEILTANFMGRDILIASGQASRPAMLIPSALKHKLRTGAGGKTFVGNKEMQGLKMGDLVSRLIDSSGYPFGENNHEKWQELVNNRFGKSLFLALNSADPSAYQNIDMVRGMQAERAVLMAPFLGTLGGITDREFDRIYEIELNSGRAPEVPDEVLQSQNGRIDIQYIGPLAQILQQYYETGTLLQTVANIREVLSVAPDSEVNYDGDELMQKILKSGNSPEEIIVNREDVADIKAIAAQELEQKQQLQLAEQASGMVPNLSKKIEDDSVLSQIAAA